MELNDIQSRYDLGVYLARQNLVGRGVEVGVLKGEFSRALLKAWPGTLYMVDAWRTHSIHDINNGGHIEQLQNMSEAFKNVYEFKERAVIVRHESAEAAKFFADESLDFVYIDAGHDYKSVAADLKAWYPKVKNGGLFCGDDYLDGVLLYHGATLFEVKRAVDDFAKERGLDIIETNNTYNEFPQWWCKVEKGASDNQG